MSFKTNIDAVYLWVDGNNPDFQKHLQLYLHERGESFATAPHRFSDHNELKYSLRSLHLNCPWIRRIFIIAPDGMQPAWLNTQHPQIELVHHRDFFPAKAVLPTFQSDTIQSFLHHIKQLSEHFILLDDDFFIGKPMTPNHFFTNEGKAKCTFMRLKHNIKKSILRSQWSPFDQSIYNTNQLLRIAQTNSCSPFRGLLSYGLHQASAFRKTAFSEMWENPIFRPQLEKQTLKRFRSSENIQPILLSKHTALNLNIGLRAKPPEYCLLSLNDQMQWLEDLRAIVQRPPTLFCLNDVMESPRSDLLKQLETALETLYPDPSPYERECPT